MRLDEVTAEIRPRSDWEAVDLGFAMVRRDFWRCFCSWWLAMALPTAVVAYGLWDYPLVFLMLFWWAKPAGSRLVLFQISRRLFGEQPSWRAVWRELPRAWYRRFFFRFVWARFSPWLPVTLAVEDLEELRGKTYRQRCEQVVRRGSGAVMVIYGASEGVAAWLTVAILGMIKMLIPDGQDTAWQTALESWDRDVPFEIPLLILRTIAGCMVLSISLTDLFVIGAGFGIYINNRTWIEGWDVELAFKRLAQRLTKSGLALVLLFTFSTIYQVRADPPQSPTDLIQEVKNHPDFKIHSETYRVPKEKPSKSSPLKPPSFDLGPQAQLLFAVCGLTLLAGLVGWLLWRYRHVFRMRSHASDCKKKGLSAKTVMGMAVTAASLPPDVPVAAWNLWLLGRHQEAMALLYRGSISRVIEQGSIEIQESDTESDCMRRVEKSANSSHAEYFRHLTAAWVRLAYAGLTPTDATVQEFCQQWPFEARSRR